MSLMLSTRVRSTRFYMAMACAAALSANSAFASSSLSTTLPDKAAILVISAHPDDEGIFFGGTLPYYSQVRNLPTVLLSFTSGDWRYSAASREKEQRNAAEVYGLEYDPIFPRFRDVSERKTTDKTFEVPPK